LSLAVAVPLNAAEHLAGSVGTVKVSQALEAAARPPGRQGASPAAEAARGMAAVCQSEFALDFVGVFRIVPDGQDDYLTGLFEDRKQYLVI
jgi:hypothetical protein